MSSSSLADNSKFVCFIRVRVWVNECANKRAWPSMWMEFKEIVMSLRISECCQNRVRADISIFHIIHCMHIFTFGKNLFYNCKVRLSVCVSCVCLVYAVVRAAMKYRSNIVHARKFNHQIVDRDSVERKKSRIMSGHTILWHFVVGWTLSRTLSHSHTHTREQARKHRIDRFIIIKQPAQSASQLTAATYTQMHSMKY